MGSDWSSEVISKIRRAVPRGRTMRVSAPCDSLAPNAAHENSERRRVQERHRRQVRDHSTPDVGLLQRLGQLRGDKGVELARRLDERPHALACPR